MRLFNSEKRRARMEQYKNAVYKEWGKISAQGKKKYVLIKATYGWALQVFLVYIAMMYVLSRFNDAFIFDWFTVLFSAVIFVLFGAWQGSMEFDRNERIYREKFPYKKKK